MKKGFVLSIAAALCALTPCFLQAQKGNPLKNIPVNYMPGVDAKISIDDFEVNGDEIVVTSTLIIPTPDGSTVSYEAVYPIDVVSSSCNQLVFTAATVSADEFHIGGFTVIVTPADIKEKKLTSALCSIAELNNNGGSSHAIVAKLKQAVRALL